MTNTTIKFRTASLLASLLAILAGTALAQDASAPVLRIATGPKDGVYTQMALDMQKVCGQIVPMTFVPSQGGLENLNRLSANEADLGFAQIDLMQRMGKNGDQNIRDLQAVVTLHSNLLHVLAKKNGAKNLDKSLLNPFGDSRRAINKFSDLKGARVALVGSAQLTGQSLEEQLGYGMSFRPADTADKAFEMLNADKVDAVFITGGWPYGPISSLPSGSGLMLLEYDLKPQAPFTQMKRNYPNMMSYNLSFLASTNVLLSNPFKPNGMRGKMVAALQKCIVKNLDELQEGPYQAAWKEVHSPLDAMGIAAIASAK